jgi:hypothetical protein
MAAYCGCCGAEITLKAEACAACGAPQHGMSFQEFSLTVAALDPMPQGNAANADTCRMGTIARR